MPLKTNNQTEDWINKEAGTILTLAKEFAEEAQAFVEKNGDIKGNRSDKENYSPEARMYFLSLKWISPSVLPWPHFYALEVEDQGGNSMDLNVFSTEPGPSHVWSLETGLNS